MVGSGSHRNGPQRASVLFRQTARRGRRRRGGGSSAGTVVTVTGGRGEVVDVTGPPLGWVVLVVTTAPWGEDEVVVSGAEVAVVVDASGAGCTWPRSVVIRIDDGPESERRVSSHASTEDGERQRQGAAEHDPATPAQDGGARPDDPEQFLPRTVGVRR